MGDNGRARRKGDDVSALKVAYEHHAAELHDFGRWMLGRADAAEDAVHAVLIGALGRRGLLWNPDKLRTWLYAAIRNECLRARRRESLDAPATTPDQEALELSLRHRLSPDALAVVFGVPVRTVHRMLAHNQELLADRYRTSEPVGPAPDDLYGRILESARIPDRVTYFTERAQPYTRAGYPVPLDRPESRRLLPMALAVVATIMIVLLTSLLTKDQPPPSSAARLPEPSVVLSSDVPMEPSLIVQSPSPSTSPTPSRKPSRSPKPKPPASKPPSTGPAPGVRIMLAESRCGRSGWSMHVALLTSGPATKSATVTWWTSNRSPVTVTAFRFDETTYATQVRGLPQYTEVFFRGAAVSVAGRTGQSATTSAAGACDGGRTRR